MYLYIISGYGLCFDGEQFENGSWIDYDFRVVQFPTLEEAKACLDDEYKYYKEELLKKEEDEECADDCYDIKSDYHYELDNGSEHIWGSIKKV